MKEVHQCFTCPFKKSEIVYPYNSRSITRHYCSKDPNHMRIIMDINHLSKSNKLCPLMNVKGN